jgi:hypothetical protein
MKNQIASVSEIKKELQILDKKELLNICLRLVKFKKDNKELTNYLLFQKSNENHFVEGIKSEMTEMFDEMNKSNVYFAKKTIRKVLRVANKNAKYSGLESTHIEILIHFCVLMNTCGIDYKKSTALCNLYQAQVVKIKKVISTLHEDLQYDYLKEIEQQGI